MRSTPKASTEYLEELRIQLRGQGFTVHCNESRDIDVEHDGSTLCRINDCGNLGYFAEKIAGKTAMRNTESEKCLPPALEQSKTMRRRQAGL